MTKAARNFTYAEKSWTVDFNAHQRLAFFIQDDKEEWVCINFNYH